MKSFSKLLVFCLLFSNQILAQQVADTSFSLPISQPRFPAGTGSKIFVDAAHHNFHTLDGRFLPFGKLLRADGYQLLSNPDSFTQNSLRDCRILVIANALHPSNAESWRLPNPSAFSPTEIELLQNWVKSGGRLLLIADHMPFAGAAQSLARAFGFEFSNCFAFDNRRRRVERFFRSNGSLFSHEITRDIDTLVTFTGSAFQIPAGAQPILALPNYTLLLPSIEWQFEEDTPALPSDGFFQGASLVFGKGKIVVMGEAAMFTAQLAGAQRNTVGFNAPAARQNGQFLLNLIHWLDR